MSLILLFALLIALLFYTLCYYITHKLKYGDVIVTLTIAAVLIAILVIAFYA